MLTQEHYRGRACSGYTSQGGCNICSSKRKRRAVLPFAFPMIQHSLLSASTVASRSSRCSAASCASTLPLTGPTYRLGYLTHKSGCASLEGERAKHRAVGVCAEGCFAPCASTAACPHLASAGQHICRSMTRQGAQMLQATVSFVQVLPSTFTTYTTSSFLTPAFLRSSPKDVYPGLMSLPCEAAPPARGQGGTLGAHPSASALPGPLHPSPLLHPAVSSA